MHCQLTLTTWASTDPNLDEGCLVSLDFVEYANSRLYKKGGEVDYSQNTWFGSDPTS